MNRKICYFAGHVQGVGFRYTAQELARGFNVTGFVRNLPDGRVELVIEGPDDETDGLIDAIKQKMEGLIHGTTCDLSPATGEFKQFSVRH